MSGVVRILVAADAAAAAAVQRALAGAGSGPHITRSESPEHLAADLAAAWDLVIVDADVAEPAAIAERLAVARTPVVALADLDEPALVAAMRRGVRDVVPRGHHEHLAHVAVRELAESTERAERLRMQELLVLSDRMASLGMLAAGIAHELNNPLAALMFNVEHALRRGADEAAEELREALRCAERIRQIVRDVRVFSRPEDSQGTVDVHEVLDSSVRMAWNEIRHRGRLDREYGAVPRAVGNEARLGQVFLNLLVNAAQAMSPERFDTNVITVATGVADDGRIRVEIRDTGQGMSPATQARLFEPFFTTKPVGAGIGLGLAISRRLVTALGGEIHVDSRAGAGTSFRVLLPAASEPRRPGAPAPRKSAPAEPNPMPEPEAPVPRNPRPDSKPNPAGGHILILDDDPAVGRMLTRLLGRRHRVTTLELAAHAIDQLAAGTRYDAILCDLMMPTMPGRTFYHHVLAIDPAQARRIVFMTGGAFTSESQEFIESVDNPCIEKPFAVPTLLAALDRVRNP
ncbi:MAG: response regulator [Myxococcales bacterium]|nr:response regulator [Myxococcales bacterium]